jgi:hypothetical protein
MAFTVYADESGTHDANGNREGSSFGVLAGWIAKDEVWRRFITDWQSVLSKYEVPFFHFSEFNTAAAIKRNPKRKVESSYSTNPYREMELAKLNAFFDDCARLLDNPDLEIVSSIFDTKIYKKEIVRETDPSVLFFKDKPYTHLIFSFSVTVLRQVIKRWGSLDEGVTFVFDDTSNADWMDAIKMAIHVNKKMGKNILGLRFQTKTDAIPIQAADMFAYRANQVCRNVQNQKYVNQPMSVLDSIINKHMKLPPEGWVSRTEPWTKSVKF